MNLDLKLKKTKKMTLKLQSIFILKNLIVVKENELKINC